MSTKASETRTTLNAMALLAAYVVSSFLLINFALEATLRDSAVLQGAVGKSPKQRQDALRRWHSAKAEAPRLHCLFLGLSTLRDGLDLPAFDALGPAGMRSLSLAGSGSSFDGLEYAFESVLDDPALHADTIILMAHPFWLGGWDPFVADPGTIGQAIDAAGTGNFSPLRRFVNGTLWLVNRRLVLTQRIDTLLSDSREHSMGWMDVPAEVLYAPHPRPWFTPPKARPNPKASAAVLASQWNSWTRMGKWQPETYAAQLPIQLAALQRLVGKAARRAAHVIVVRMPEPPALRKAFPMSVGEQLSLANITLSNAPGTIQYWDLSTALKPSHFFDHVHPNAEGRQALTQLLAQRLHDR